MITRETFLCRMNYRVAERTAVVEVLADFVKFDPHVKPTADAYLEAHAKLVEQLKLRGITGESAYLTPLTPMSKNDARSWASHFASLPVAESMAPFAKAHDAALTPFIEANETTLEALRRYIQSRVELHPAGFRRG